MQSNPSSTSQFQLNVKSKSHAKYSKARSKLSTATDFSPDRWLPSPGLDPSGGSFVCGSNYFRSVVRVARYTYIRNINESNLRGGRPIHLLKSFNIFFSISLTSIVLTRISHFRTRAVLASSLVKLNARSVKARRNEIRDGWFDNEESNARAREEQNW